MQILRQQEQREIAGGTSLFMNCCPVINGAGWGKPVSLFSLPAFISESKNQEYRQTKTSMSLFHFHVRL